MALEQTNNIKIGDREFDFEAQAVRRTPDKPIKAEALMSQQFLRALLESD